MTLMETKVVLEDGISVGGKELREIYEVVNHKKAYQYVKKCIAEGKILDEPIEKWYFFGFQCVKLPGACSASWEWPVSIAKENRLDYYNALETYAVRGELGEFADLVAEL